MKDAVQVQIRGILPANTGSAVFVGNEEKVFVISVDPNMGQIISMYLRDQRTERPLTHELLQNIFKGFGITVERVMTDNGSCYRSRRFRSACSRLGIKLIYTRPYTPRTNGKAERFIQTALREWAYARAYDTSLQRAAELPYWIHRYNWHRPHGSIGAMTPISTLALTGNNLLRLHS